MFINGWPYYNPRVLSRLKRQGQVWKIYLPNLIIKENEYEISLAMGTRVFKKKINNYVILRGRKSLGVFSRAIWHTIAVNRVYRIILNKKNLNVQYHNCVIKLMYFLFQNINYIFPQYS